MTIEAILGLYGCGELADAVTVAAALHNAVTLGKVGDAADMHTLLSAVLRRFVEAATGIVSSAAVPALRRRPSTASLKGG